MTIPEALAEAQARYYDLSIAAGPAYDKATQGDLVMARLCIELLRRAGTIPPPPPQEPQRRTRGRTKVRFGYNPVRDVSAIVAREIIDLYRSGKSTVDIAAQFKVSPPRIAYILKSYNVPMRTPEQDGLLSVSRHRKGERDAD